MEFKNYNPQKDKPAYTRSLAFSVLFVEIIRITDIILETSLPPMRYKTPNPDKPVAALR